MEEEFYKRIFRKNLGKRTKEEEEIFHGNESI